MGLSTEAAKHLDTASGGSFLYLIPQRCKEVLDKIADNIPYMNNNDDPQKEASGIEPVDALDSSDSSPEIITMPTESNSEEEDLPLEFPFIVEDHLFEDFGNASNYPTQPKPPSDSLLPSDESLCNQNIEDLSAILSHQWTNEAELSENVPRIDDTVDRLNCQIGDWHTTCLYDPSINLNLISRAKLILNNRDPCLEPTLQYIRSSSGRILESKELATTLPVILDDVNVFLDFYVFEDETLPVVIGQPWSRFLFEGSTKGDLDIKINKEQYTVPIIRAINSIAEQPPDPDPLDRINSATLQEMAQPDYEEDAQFFTEEEIESNKPFQIDKDEKPSQPSIELKPLPKGLRYAFLHGDANTPIIISDKLSEKESSMLLEVLEKHRSVFG